jgi:hypothetical protein
MIDLNRQHQQLLTHLLTDLEGIMTTNDWNSLGKTRQLWNPNTKKAQETHNAVTILGGLHGETLTIDQDIARITRDQWQWLLKYKLGKVKHLSDMLTIYDQYQPQIAALEHQRSATDTLIDQIVYTLYGLTPEEIALIEQA